MAATFATDFVAGWTAGFLGLVITYPLDTIKVRLQVENERSYKGTVHCFQQIVSRESVRGLYKGMLSPALGISVQNAVTFVSYGLAFRAADTWSVGFYAKTAFAGGVAGILQSFVMGPTELIKIQLQVKTSRNDYSGYMKCVLGIVRHQGLMGLFRGCFATVLRDVPGYASYFVIFEYIVRTLDSRNNSNPTLLMCSLAGGIAGSLSWVLVYPVDVIKSKLQGLDVSTRESASFLQISRLCCEGGVGVLYRGLMPCIMRAFPQHAVIFAVFSAMKDWLNTE